MSEEHVQPEDPTPTPQANWQYRPVPSSAQPLSATPAQPSQPASTITWTASSHIVHQKGAAWYGAVLLIAAALATATYFLTNDLISTIAIVVAGLLFCLAGARKPPTLQYTMDRDGIRIGQRFYPYVEFRSFTVVHQGTFSLVELWPHKRLMPMINIYFSPDDEDRIVDMLSEYVPYEQRNPAYIDRFARYIRF